MTNQSSLWFECDLKRCEIKQSVSDKGGTQSCSTGQYEKNNVFFSALKHVNLFWYLPNVILWTWKWAPYSAWKTTKCLKTKKMPITISHSPKPRIWIVCFVYLTVQNPKIINLQSNMTDKSNKSSHLKGRIFGIFAWKMNKHLQVAQNWIFLDKTSNFKTSSWALEICDRHFFYYYWFMFSTLSVCLLICWFVRRITKKLLKRFPWNLGGGWISVRNRPH